MACTRKYQSARNVLATGSPSGFRLNVDGHSYDVSGQPARLSTSIRGNSTLNGLNQIHETDSESHCSVPTPDKELPSPGTGSSLNKTRLSHLKESCSSYALSLSKFSDSDIASVKPEVSLERLDDTTPEPGEHKSYFIKWIRHQRFNSYQVSERSQSAS